MKPSQRLKNLLEQGTDFQTAIGIVLDELGEKLVPVEGFCSKCSEKNPRQ